MKIPAFAFVGGKMEAQENLQQIGKYDRLIENKKFEIMDMRNSASLQAGFSCDTRVQTTKRPDRAENIIVGYIEREAELQETIVELYKMRQEIIKTIELLNTNEYGVLYCVFVEGKGLQEAADQVDRSYSWAAYTKKKGLDSLQKILDERKKHELQNC